MKQISTITRHRRIISYYAELICNHVKDLKALEQTATRFGIKRMTVDDIVKSNDKYFKIKKCEFNKCPVKLKE